MFRIVVFAALVFLAAFPPVRAQEAGVIASMDEMRFNPNPLFVHDRVH